MADWTFVCNTSDVDFEDQYRFDHNDRTYCIYHLEDGFYATDGLCTHEDVHLVDGLIDGEEIYNDFCAQCHLEDGEGVNGIYPPLANSDFLIDIKKIIDPEAISQNLVGIK